MLSIIWHKEPEAFIVWHKDYRGCQYIHKYCDSMKKRKTRDVKTTRYKSSMWTVNHIFLIHSFRPVEFSKTYKLSLCPLHYHIISSCQQIISVSMYLKMNCKSGTFLHEQTPQSISKAYRALKTLCQTQLCQGSKLYVNRSCQFYIVSLQYRACNASRLKMISQESEKIF